MSRLCVSAKSAPSEENARGFVRSSVLGLVDGERIGPVEFTAIGKQVRAPCDRLRSQHGLPSQLGDVGEQRLGDFEPACGLCREGRIQQSPGARFAVHRQPRRLLKSPCLGSNAATPTSCGRGVLERGGDGLVRSIRGRGEMPGTAVRLVGHRRKGSVRGAALTRPGALVDGRARERVAEVQPSRVQQARFLGSLDRVSVETSGGKRLPESVGVDWVARRN